MPFDSSRPGGHDSRMFEILPETEGRRFYIRARGRLADADYKDLTPRLEAAIEAFGPIRLYADLEDFRGWEPAAAWDDFVLGIRHWNDFERVALVGDKAWEDVAARVMDRLSKGAFRFFPLDRRAEARAWIEDAS